MSWEAARVIDFHAHVVLEETFGAAAEHGPELTVAEDGRPLFRAGGYRLHGVRYRGSPFMDVEVRLAAMDRAGIDCGLQHFAIQVWLIVCCHSSPLCRELRSLKLRQMPSLPTV